MQLYINYYLDKYHALFKLTSLNFFHNLANAKNK